MLLVKKVYHCSLQVFPVEKFAVRLLILKFCMHLYVRVVNLTWTRACTGQVKCSPGDISVCACAVSGMLLYKLFHITDYWSYPGYKLPCQKTLRVVWYTEREGRLAVYCSWRLDYQLPASLFSSHLEICFERVWKARPRARSPAERRLALEPPRP